MHNKSVDRYYRIDVMPCADAPWAPTSPGTALRWAWRIVDESGQIQAIGSSNLPEQEVRNLAAAAVTRLKNYHAGKPPKINPTLKRKGSSKTNVSTLKD